MNLNDYSYHNYPSSLVRKYRIYTLEDNNQGIDKYYFNLQQSYVHNFLDKRRFERINLLYPKNTKSIELNEESKKEEGQLPLLTEPNQKEVIKSKNEVKSRNKNNQCCQKALTTRKGFRIKDSPRMTKLSINSLMKPIHNCKRNQPKIKKSYISTSRYKENYLSESYRLRNELKNSQHNMNNTMNISLDSYRAMRKNSPFDLYQKKQRELIMRSNMNEENAKYIDCLNRLKEGDRYHPKLKELMELDQTRTQNIHFNNKYMGEKYNPHNYKIDNSKK